VIPGEERTDKGETDEKNRKENETNIRILYKYIDKSTQKIIKLVGLVSLIV
jgi:hypothetical protein